MKIEKLALFYPIVGIIFQFLFFIIFLFLITVAAFPFSLIIVPIILLFVAPGFIIQLKVLSERLKNKEDKHYAQSKQRQTHVITVTTDFVPSHEVVQDLGLVRGNVVRAKHIGTDTIARARNFVGGEIPEYSKMMEEAREHALDKMILQAETNGANAVIGVKFSTSMVMTGASEILAYGTAVKTIPISPIELDSPQTHPTSLYDTTVGNILTKALP